LGFDVRFQGRRKQNAWSLGFLRDSNELTRIMVDTLRGERAKSKGRENNAEDHENKCSTKRRGYFKRRES
jgi:hypothetical protein